MAESYADKNYQQKKEIYDVLAQALEDIKYGTTQSVLNSDNSMHGGTGWNRFSHELKGVTMRFLGENHLSLSCHRIETGTTEHIRRMNQTEDGRRFLREIEKKLRERFEELTGKSVTLKEESRDQNVQKWGRVSPETAAGFGGVVAHRNVGRYLVVDSCVYSFNASL